MLYDPEKNVVVLIADMVKNTGADGVVYLLTKFCDPEEFDAPIVKKFLDREGIPSIIIEIDQQTSKHMSRQERRCKLLQMCFLLNNVN